jgi:hypothetical protein
VIEKAHRANSESRGTTRTVHSCDCANFTTFHPQPCFNFMMKRDAKVWLLIASMVVGGLVSAVQGHSVTDTFLDSAKASPAACAEAKSVTCKLPSGKQGEHEKR